MPPDTLSDEQLVAAYRAGDENVLKTLFDRYMTPVKAYFFKHSFCKDENFIDDARQIIFETIYNGIITKAFTGTNPGSFRAYLFEVCRRLCLKQNQNQIRAPKNISAVYPESSDDTDDLYFLKVSDEAVDYGQISEKYQAVIAELNPIELKLMHMVGDGISYEQIHQEPEFFNYGLDYLMQKVYLIRQRMRRKFGAGGDKI